MQMTFSVAVVGASGYAGGELVRLLDEHPEFEVGMLAAHSKAGRTLREVHPHLRHGDRSLVELDSSTAASHDLVFLALPHGASAELGHELAEQGVRVVDLGSDFRLDTPERYLKAYGSEHPFPAELASWNYGLPELAGDALKGATRVAAPGCYPTAALVGLAPLLAADAVHAEGIVVNAMSGTTGAGRTLRDDLLFGSVDEGVRAYGVGGHRHRPEIEMFLEHHAGVDRVSVTFTPHLVPMLRGIFSTATVPTRPGVRREDLLSLLKDVYVDRPFVEVIDSAPQTRWVVGSNRALVTAFVDEHTGQAVVLSAIDNLLKGAAGQAVQAANLMVGLPEVTGLPLAGWMP